MDHLQKAKKEYKNLNKQKVHYIYQNELDKPYFQHNISYGDFKDLIRRAASEKLLCDKAFNIGKNLKYDRYQCRLVSVVYKFFIKILLLLVQVNLLVVVLKMTVSQMKN